MRDQLCLDYYYLPPSSLPCCLKRSLDSKACSCLYSYWLTLPLSYWKARCDRHCCWGWRRSPYHVIYSNSNLWHWSDLNCYFVVWAWSGFISYSLSAWRSVIVDDYRRWTHYHSTQSKTTCHPHSPLHNFWMACALRFLLGPFGSLSFAAYPIVWDPCTF